VAERSKARSIKARGKKIKKALRKVKEVLKYSKAMDEKKWKTYAEMDSRKRPQDPQWCYSMYTVSYMGLGDFFRLKSSYDLAKEIDDIDKELMGYGDSDTKNKAFKDLVTLDDNPRYRQLHSEYAALYKSTRHEGGRMCQYCTWELQKALGGSCLNLDFKPREK